MPTNNMSDKEYYNFSDSSLELFDTFKPRKKKQTKSNLKLNSNVNFDQIDLTNASYFESKSINTDLSSSIITVNSYSSIPSTNNSSNESFKSTLSSLSSPMNIINDNQNLYYSSTENSNITSSKLENHNGNSATNNVRNSSSPSKNNYSTPKKSLINPLHLSESIKLLDRLYGKEWRCVDGVLKNCNRTNLNDVFDNNDE